MTITVIGKDSFLAKALRHHIQRFASSALYRFLDYKESLENTGWIHDTKIVINFAFSPNMHQIGYKESEDIDSEIAKSIKEHSDISYIMISSRKVYGPLEATNPADETKELSPDTPYGDAKKEIEIRLQDTLGSNRLTIMRLANVFGSELGRKTFFGIALSSLLDSGIITYDFDPATKKDFISATYFAEALHSIVQRQQAGTYNLGSGFSIECKKIAEWLIDGFGSGELKSTEHMIKDSFELSMKKTLRSYNIKPYSQENLRLDCLEAIKDAATNHNA